MYTTPKSKYCSDLNSTQTITPIRDMDIMINSYNNHATNTNTNTNFGRNDTI